MERKEERKGRGEEEKEGSEDKKMNIFGSLLKIFLLAPLCKNRDQIFYIINQLISKIHALKTDG